jgi:hypothetical protein
MKLLGHNDNPVAGSDYPTSRSKHVAVRYTEGSESNNGSGGSNSGGSSPLAGKKMLVLGVGGAGRAIAFGAVQAGAQVTLVECSPISVV